MRRIELAVVAAALVAVTVFWALVPTYPALDSYYALVWGREAFGGHSPTFSGYRAPTHHPLWVLVSGLLSLAGGDADRLLVLVALWCLVLFLWGMYRLGTGAVRALGRGGGDGVRGVELRVPALRGAGVRGHPVPRRGGVGGRVRGAPAHAGDGGAAARRGAAAARGLGPGGAVVAVDGAERARRATGCG